MRDDVKPLDLQQSFFTSSLRNPWEYFAIQTRRQELADELTLSGLPEDQKRLIYRREMIVLNHQLAEAAKLSGVIKPEHFATFTDQGYEGLYAGETEKALE
jgi:DNA-damage-inducible protein D